jgi:hypothetical protein
VRPCLKTKKKKDKKKEKEKKKKIFGQKSDWFCQGHVTTS